MPPCTPSPILALPAAMGPFCSQWASPPVPCREPGEEGANPRGSGDPWAHAWPGQGFAPYLGGAGAGPPWSQRVPVPFPFLFPFPFPLPFPFHFHTNISARGSGSPGALPSLPAEVGALGESPPGSAAVPGEGGGEMG